MRTIIKNIKFTDHLMILIGILFPWTIIFATPQLHIGYWGQVEGMVCFSHFLSAIVALLLLKIGINNKEIRQYFVHPIVLLPALIGVYSIIASSFQMLPVLALYGSPQLGQGAFGYFSLSLLTVLYLYVFKINKVKFFLLINFLCVTLAITIGSFYPSITGIVISFFGFYDWLALYYVSFMICALHLLEIKKHLLKKIIINKEILSFLFFLTLGPLFWQIENNSSIVLWIAISLSWLIWLINFHFNIKVKIFHELIYSPLFFTLVPIILSLIMILSSFMFWDGKTDMTDEITDNMGHLATLVARGSIVRVLLEHLDSMKALLFGYGWGSISELLLKSFTPEVFYQINTGNRVHFHTHNELFEHVFSIGLIGAFLYVAYIYNIFKCSFKISIAVSFLWLLYFCIGAFWFQWTSNISVNAMLAAILLLKEYKNIKYIYSDRVSKLFNSIYFYSAYLIIAAIFLFYGAYIGFYTAFDHSNSNDAQELIDTYEESELSGNCSNNLYDFGKGGFQFSQKLNGFSTYFKKQVILYGVVNESDYNVLEWNLCASNKVIQKKQASLELINVHINTLSMLSVLPGEYGVESRRRMKLYLDLWEDKLKLLLLFAPKRGDQVTPLISYYMQNDDDIALKNICYYLEERSIYQGFCDLSLGSIYLKEGRIDEGMMLIDRANKMGVLDSKHLDKETSDTLKKSLHLYKSN
jgi:hypothetical protein